MKSQRSFKQRRKLELAKQFIIRQVEGNSMAPALKAGQLVIGKQTRELSPGDVVIVSHNGLEKIKRIEQQQGDLIYLLGDNSSASTDSRDFGWLPAKTIIAKVIWPKL
jgi:phage repressor protein C with HTH and peptisase S24 domain